MPKERTLSIIKPDAVAKNVVGQIYARFEAGGLSIVGARMIQLTPEQAGEFYQEHQGKDFYGELLAYMCSGPIFVQVLEGKNAIKVNRLLMGDTNPQAAERGTIRADFASSITANAVHGSDSPASAAREIAFFFEDDDLFLEADGASQAHRYV